jgi:hypothetical protein
MTRPHRPQLAGARPHGEQLCQPRAGGVVPVAGSLRATGGEATGPRSRPAPGVPRPPRAMPPPGPACPDRQARARSKARSRTVRRLTRAQPPRCGSRLGPAASARSTAGRPASFGTNIVTISLSRGGGAAVRRRVENQSRRTIMTRVSVAPFHSGCHWDQLMASLEPGRVPRPTAGPRRDCSGQDGSGSPVGWTAGPRQARRPPQARVWLLADGGRNDRSPTASRISAASPVRATPWRARHGRARGACPGPKACTGSSAPRPVAHAFLNRSSTAAASACLPARATRAEQRPAVLGTASDLTIDRLRLGRLPPSAAPRRGSGGSDSTSPAARCEAARPRPVAAVK